MATIYSARSNKPHGVGRLGFGGAGLNLDVAALAGETDLVTVFDDFNGQITAHSFGVGAGLGLQGMGWVLTDIGTPANDTIGMNDAAVASRWNSCLHIVAGDDADEGGNMQLDAVAATDADAALSPEQRHNFKHMWIPETAAGVTVLDNTVVVFACRLGFQTVEAAGDWDGKAYVGFAGTGDVGIMTVATGAIPASLAALVGFHIAEDGSIDGISSRDETAAPLIGTSAVEMHAAGAVDSTLANGANAIGDVMWFDLALRMDITNMNDDAANGTTTFFSRRVPKVGGTNEIVGAVAPGLRETQASNSTRATSDDWAQTGQLLNVTPNAAIALVPTIEVINGGAGENVQLFMDWWSFGMSRFSRQ